jgi:hypothetical protein
MRTGKELRMTIPRCGIIGLMATLFFAGPAAADQTIEIRLPQLASIPEYTVPLLELALSKQDRPFKIVLPENSKDLTAVEVMEKLTDPASSEFNLYAAGTSKHYEEIALPIRVPLVRGLIGARINAIPKGSQNKFLSVNTVGDLKDMTCSFKVSTGETLHYP